MADDPNFVGAIPLYAYMEGMELGSMEREVLDLWVNESDIWAALPILPARGGKYRYPQVAALPEVQRRAYNEPGNVSQGRTEIQEEGIFLWDEYIFWDRAMEDHFGPGGRAVQERLKFTAMARDASRLLLKGDHLADPRDPDGLQARSASPEQAVVPNSTASGGGPLSLGKLDIALRKVRYPTHIIADRDVMPLFDAAARSPTLTNNMFTNATDPLGRTVTRYKGIPILEGYPRSLDDSILPFTEVGAGGGAAATTSIYVVSFRGDEGVFAVEGVPLTVRDEGQLPGTPRKSTHMKWDFGFVSKPFSICRLSSITNAAIVA